VVKFSGIVRDMFLEVAVLIKSLASGPWLSRLIAVMVLFSGAAKFNDKILTIGKI
jgi:hypothetical protein